ncbi:MAG: response regulator [Candidatus Saccharibacteria bacterium]
MTITRRDLPIILMADDDDDDFLLTERALRASGLRNHLVRVLDGEELLDYLHARDKYKQTAVRPGLILLDLNMPRMDGSEALLEIKSSPEFRDIPVIIFTTSKDEDDIYRSYQLGGNSFIAKPITFEGLTAVMRTIGAYWFETVELPISHEQSKK